MGQAKQRRENAAIVYHHTSVLRTNLIWMSGVIALEGTSKGAIHPILGEVRTNGALRRRMTDFPPLVWFTANIEPPKCLTSAELVFTDDTTGEVKARLDIDEAVARGLTMTRVALGFSVSDIAVHPWREHPGYETPSIETPRRTVPDQTLQTSTRLTTPKRRTPIVEVRNQTGGSAYIAASQLAI